MPLVQHLAEVTSTMVVGHEMARQGAEHGAAVTAKVQSGARGTRGRQWSSGEGGLWLSVVLRPPNGAHLELLPIRIGLAVASAVEHLCGHQINIGLKWPNDLFIDGRKVGGVLCEAHWRGNACLWLVAGVGVNIQNLLPEELHATATRLSDHLAETPSLEVLQDGVVAAIGGLSEWGSMLTAAEMLKWQQRDVLWGQTIISPLPGMASGITPDGGLLVRGEDGAERVATVGVARNAD